MQTARCLILTKISIGDRNSGSGLYPGQGAGGGTFSPAPGVRFGHVDVTDPVELKAKHIAGKMSLLPFVWLDVCVLSLLCVSFVLLFGLMYVCVLSFMFVSFILLLGLMLLCL